MTISLSDVGKRFNREWIFRNITQIFQSGQSYALTGANGSGKSTLLQLISGAIHFNEGKLSYTSDDNKPIPPEHFYLKNSFCAPYLELVEEMTLLEFLAFHNEFKPFLKGFTPESIVELLGMEKAANKQIRNYSSGMKQRVKLAQCILSDTPVVLLDEPCTNLDALGIALYKRLITDYCLNRLVIVSSNDEVEYSFCKHRLSMADYK